MDLWRTKVTPGSARAVLSENWKIYRVVVILSLLCRYETWTLYWRYIKLLKKFLVVCFLFHPQHSLAGLKIFDHSTEFLIIRAQTRQMGHFIKMATICLTKCSVLPGIRNVTLQRTVQMLERHRERNPISLWHPAKGIRGWGCWQNPLLNLGLWSLHKLWR